MSTHVSSSLYVLTSHRDINHLLPHPPVLKPLLRKIKMNKFTIGVLTLAACSQSVEAMGSARQYTGNYNGPSPPPPKCPGVVRFPDCTRWLHDANDTTLSTDVIANGKCRFGFKQSDLSFGSHCTVACEGIEHRWNGEDGENASFVAVVSSASSSDLSVQCECTSRMEARFGIMFRSAVYQGGWLALGLMSSVATAIVVYIRLCDALASDEQKAKAPPPPDCHAGWSIFGAILFCVGPILLLIALFGTARAKLTEFFAGKFRAGVGGPKDWSVAEGGPALIKTTFWIGCTDAGIRSENNENFVDWRNFADPASVADPSNLNWAGSVVVVLAAALVVIAVPIYCIVSVLRCEGKGAASTPAELNVEEASISASPSWREISV